MMASLTTGNRTEGAAAPSFMVPICLGGLAPDFAISVTNGRLADVSCPGCKPFSRHPGVVCPPQIVVLSLRGSGAISFPDESDGCPASKDPSFLGMTIWGRRSTEWSVSVVVSHQHRGSVRLLHSLRPWCDGTDQRRQTTGRCVHILLSYATTGGGSAAALRNRWNNGTHRPRRTTQHDGLATRFHHRAIVTGPLT